MKHIPLAHHFLMRLAQYFIRVKAMAAGLVKIYSSMTSTDLLYILSFINIV